jgi:hypothetical protein
MAKSKGYQSIVGLHKGVTWGTAIVCGALDGLEVLSVDLEGNRGIIPRPTITGRVSRIEGDKGNIEVGGSIRLPLRFEGVGRLIAGLFGTAGVPATLDTSARVHTFKIADSIDGLFWTLVYEELKDTTIFEFDSVKITSVTLRWQIPGQAILEVEFIGSSFTDASIINTTTTIDTITQSANNEIAQARHLAGGIRLNAQSGGALGASDAVDCTAGEVTITRPLERDFTTALGDKSSEPMPPQGDAAFLTVSGSLTFSQYQTGSPGGNAAYVLEQLNRTTKKMDWSFVGDGLAGAATEKYSHKLYFPMVVFGSGKPKLAAGAGGWQIPFESHHVTTAPTGFVAGHVDACTWLNTNKLTTDVLA